MMGGYWTAGKTVDVSPEHFAECIDGELWKVCHEPTENVVGFVNPTNCVSSAGVEQAIHSLVRVLAATDPEDVGEEPVPWGPADLELLADLAEAHVDGEAVDYDRAEARDAIERARRLAAQQRQERRGVPVEE